MLGGRGREDLVELTVRSERAGIGAGVITGGVREVLVKGLGLG